MKLDIVSVDRAFERTRLARTLESAGDLSPVLFQFDLLVCASTLTAHLDVPCTGNIGRRIGSGRDAGKQQKQRQGSRQLQHELSQCHEDLHCESNRTRKISARE